MGNNIKEVKHIELLIFSNLTNLEWQFVNLNPQDEEDEDGNMIKVFPKLNNLLTPKFFMRKDAEGKFVKYEYMENVKSEDDITQKDMDEGLFKLRKHAGIAMEYLEKDEDNFMKDWEVIYAADSYKVVKDYIDNIQEKIQRKLGIQPDKKAKYYPTRKELEKIEEKQRRVEIGYKTLSTGLDIGESSIISGLRFK